MPPVAAASLAGHGAGLHSLASGARRLAQQPGRLGDALGSSQRQAKVAQHLVLRQQGGKPRQQLVTTTTTTITTTTTTTAAAAATTTTTTNVAPIITKNTCMV